MGDHQRDDACVGHLEQVVVLEVPRDFAEDDRRQPFRRELLVQLFQSLPGAAVAACVDIPAGEIVDASDRWRARAGDDHFADVRADRIREIDHRLELRPDDDLGEDQVDLAIDQRGAHLVTRERHEDHVDLGRGLRPEFLVQVVLESHAHLVGGTALRPLVHEVEGPVGGDPDADDAARRHLVQIAGERLGEVLSHPLRQRRLVRRRRQGLFRGGLRRAGCRRGLVGLAAPDRQEDQCRERESAHRGARNGGFLDSRHGATPRAFGRRPAFARD